MKLLLTSKGIANKSIENALLNLLGKPFEESIAVFVPTSGNIQKGDKTWFVDEMNSFRKLNFKEFQIFDIAIVSKELWLEAFEKSDIIIFGGGNNEYLLEQLDKLGAREVLIEFVKTRVYAGISAGSMVTGPTDFLSSKSISYFEQHGKIKELHGLGLVNFETRSHFNSSHFPKVRIDFLQKLANETTRTFYAIDDQTAIQVVDQEVTVVSEGQWKKFN